MFDEAACKADNFEVNTGTFGEEMKSVAKRVNQMKQANEKRANL